MPLWGKEDKTTARPKFVQLKADGSIAQDSSGKKLVFLSAEEATVNTSNGASSSGWYLVLTTNKDTAKQRVRMELLVAIADEERGSVNNAQFIETHILNTNTDVSADGAPGLEDPNGRPGWYFTNDAAGKKINWYFFDGRIYNVTVGNFSAYAIVTLDSTASKPFLAVYTAPTGSGDIVPGFAHSSRVYTWPAGSVTDTKYLVYVGENPEVHSELPRVQLIAGITRGSFTASQRVLTAALNTDSSATQNGVEFVVDTLGINTTTIKADIELRLDSSDTLEESSDLN